MTSRTGSARRVLGDFTKVSELRWDLPRKKTVGFRLLAETFVAGATRVGGGADEKARIEILCLSLPYVKEPLNSKVIKSFVPEQRSRQVFFVFGDSYVLSLWTFDWRFTHGRILLCNMCSLNSLTQLTKKSGRLVTLPLYTSGRIVRSVRGRCSRGVMVKAMDCGIVVSEFELQSRYYIHFQTNTLGKGMNALILPTIGYKVPLLFS